jgi:hypothetical protein
VPVTALARLVSRILLALVWLVALSLVLVVVLLATSGAAPGPRLGSAIAGGVVIAVALAAVRLVLERAARTRR